MQQRLKERIRTLVRQYIDSRERYYGKSRYKTTSQLEAISELNRLLNYYLHKTYRQHCRMVQQMEKSIHRIQPHHWEGSKAQELYQTMLNMLKHCKEELREKQQQLSL